jgi:glyoxylase-like metal-dependent hydrolase (beta-lactamase superfamily II)
MAQKGMVLVSKCGMILLMSDHVLKIRSFTGGMAQTNGYLLGSSQNGGSCVLIDAPLGISQWLDELNEAPSSLLLTHQHYDHIEDAAKMAAKGTKIYAYSPYAQNLTLEILLQQSGIPINITSYTVDQILEGHSALEAGGVAFRLEHVPGHSPDSVVFIHEDLVFGGDTLFAGGIGRADLPDGDMDLLVKGIKEKMLILPNSTKVFPGHGTDTTIELEKATNPFL